MILVVFSLLQDKRKAQLEKENEELQKKIEAMERQIKLKLEAKQKERQRKQPTQDPTLQLVKPVFVSYVVDATANTTATKPQTKEELMAQTKLEHLCIDSTQLALLCCSLDLVLNQIEIDAVRIVSRLHFLLILDFDVSQALKTMDNKKSGRVNLNDFVQYVNLLQYSFSPHLFLAS
jgi:hypothetical protein